MMNRSRSMDRREWKAPVRSRSWPGLPDQIEEFRFADDGDRHALADEFLRGQQLRAFVARDVVVATSSLNDDVDSTRDVVRNGCSCLSDQNLGIKSSNRERAREGDRFPFKALERLSVGIVMPLQRSKHVERRREAVSSGADRLGHDIVQVVSARQFADVFHADQTVGFATKQHGEQLAHLKDII